MPRCRAGGNWWDVIVAACGIETCEDTVGVVCLRLIYRQRHQSSSRRSGQISVTQGLL